VVAGLPAQLFIKIPAAFSSGFPAIAWVAWPKGSHHSLSSPCSATTLSWRLPRRNGNAPFGPVHDLSSSVGRLLLVPGSTTLRSTSPADKIGTPRPRCGRTSAVARFYRPTPLRLNQHYEQVSPLASFYLAERLVALSRPHLPLMGSDSVNDPASLSIPSTLFLLVALSGAWSQHDARGHPLWVAESWPCSRRLDNGHYDYSTGSFRPRSFVIPLRRVTQASKTTAYARSTRVGKKPAREQTCGHPLRVAISITAIGADHDQRHDST